MLIRSNKHSMSARFSNIEKRFYSILKEVDTEIRSFVDAIDVTDIAKHNAGYRAYGVDKFGNFVLKERKRFLKVLSWIDQSYKYPLTACDLGCFIPYLPLALKKLGWSVKIVDKYELYGSSFNEHIKDFAYRNAIELYDIDILNDDFRNLGKIDVVMLMAVVEHLHGSPLSLLEKIKFILTENGNLIFEVPNIAEFNKRIFLLLGRSPLANYEDYLNSSYPFTGHHREMTRSEVKLLLDKSGYKIDYIDCYDYGFGKPKSLKGKLLFSLRAIAPFFNKGQAIIAKASIK